MGKETEKRVTASRDALEGYTLAYNSLLKASLALAAATQDRDAKQLILQKFVSSKIPTSTDPAVAAAKEAAMEADPNYQQKDLDFLTAFKKVGGLASELSQWQKRLDADEARLKKCLADLETFLNAKKKPPNHLGRVFLKEARDAIK